MAQRGSYQKISPGDLFGRLAVLERCENATSGGTKWRCVCECGATKNVLGCNLRTGTTRSCGCLAKEISGDRLRTHGGTSVDAKLYAIWSGIKSRCQNPADAAFNRYGGRGITLDSRWEDFAQFRSDIGPRPSPAHSIDRMNNDGPYSPDNCRWATGKEQGRNTRRNHIVAYQGREMPLVEACELSGVKYDLAKLRIRRGEPLDRVFDPGSHRRKRKDARWVTLNGEQVCLTEAAERRGLTYACVAARLKRGASLEQALAPI